jgi:hypothetical protein
MHARMELRNTEGGSIMCANQNNKHDDKYFEQLRELRGQPIRGIGESDYIRRMATIRNAQEKEKKKRRGECVAASESEWNKYNDI